MTESEYWLMEVVLYWRDCIEALAPDETGMLEMHFNREGHGLSLDELADTLDRMFQRGDIIAEKFGMSATGGCEERSVSGLYCPSRHEIEEILSRTPPAPDVFCVYYGLTAQGGEKWETHSRPNWNLYMDRSGYDDERGSDGEEVASSNRPLLEGYLERVQKQGFVRTDSIEWEELAPWYPTYWKTLPHGYRVHYLFPEDMYITDHRSPPWYTNFHGVPSPEA